MSMASFPVWVVGLSTDEDGAHDQEEFSHDDAECAHLGAASVLVFLVGTLEVAISPADGKRGHVEGLADAGVTDFAHAGPLLHRGSGFVELRAESGESAELSGFVKTGQVAEFGQDGGRGDEGDALDRAEQLVLLLQMGVPLNEGLHFVFGSLDVFFESAQVFEPLFADEGGAAGFFFAVAQGGFRCNEGVAVAAEFAQFGEFRGQGLVGFGGALKPEESQRACFEIVGFVAQAEAFDEGSWIYR